MQTARDNLRDHHGSSFVQQLAAPEVFQSSGDAGSFITDMFQVIEHHFSQNLEVY